MENQPSKSHVERVRDYFLCAMEKGQIFSMCAYPAGIICVLLRLVKTGFRVQVDLPV